MKTPDPMFKPYTPRIDLSYAERSINNEKTVLWWSAQTDILRELIRESYASYLKCPVCEIGNPMTTTEELEFIYNQFAEEIDEMFRIDEKFMA